MRSPAIVSRRVCVRVLVVIASLCSATPAAFAQAWVPPGGIGAVSISFQTINNTGHRMADGTMLRGFDSASRGFFVDFDYAFTDRLSISVGIPYIASKYLGPQPSLFLLPIDECLCWNTGWQDLNATARFNLVTGTFAVTPSVSFGTPSHNYDTMGEAVLGRNLNELRLTVDAGARLDAITPRLSVSGRYSYAFVQKVLDLPNNRSNMGIESGFAINRQLSVRGALSWQRSHGGLRSTEFVTEEQGVEFDRLLRDNFFHAGVGVSYSLPRVDVYLAYLKYVNGTDTHDGRAITFGLSWPFQLR